MAGPLLDMLVKLLQSFGNAEVTQTLSPLLPALVEYGLAYGPEHAQDLLETLAGDGDTYPAWEALMAMSTPERRIELMEEQRKLAVQATLQRAAREKAQWNLLKAILTTAVTVLSLML